MRSLAIAAVFSLAFLIAGFAPVGAQPPVPKPLPFGDWTWDLSKFNHDPVRLVKATYSARELRVVLEFQRNLSFLDEEWTGPRSLRVLVDSYGNALQVRVSPPDIMTERPPYLFLFEDEDGATIAAVRPRFDSEVIGIQGQRLRLVLTLSDRPEQEVQFIARKTKKITVVKLGGVYR
jgi:hypothetical protein